MTDDDGARRADVVPGQLTFQLPAHRGFVGCIGSIVVATVALVDRDLAAGTHLGAAVLIMADAMIHRAPQWTPLDVSIAIDDTDTYVRMTSSLLDPNDPLQFSEQVRATLNRSVESYDVHQDGNAVTAVLHVPLAPVPTA